jgi:hypothetical protein
MHVVVLYAHPDDRAGNPKNEVIQKHHSTLNILSTSMLSINPLDYKAPRDPSKKYAWVVCLFSSASYLPGILLLSHSLKKVNSAFPLIVAINPTVPDEARVALEQAGLEVRVVQPLKPSGEVTLIAERFADTWTKLAVFDFVEYEVSYKVSLGQCPGREQRRYM